MNAPALDIYTGSNFPPLHVQQFYGVMWLYEEVYPQHNVDSDAWLLQQLMDIVLSVDPCVSITFDDVSVILQEYYTMMGKDNKARRAKLLFQNLKGWGVL